MMHQQKSPRVSFVIPTLNAGKFLPKCLSAIRNQDYPQRNIQIIISDGGSTDNTVDIARHFKARIVSNPEKLHEPGKTIGMQYTTGDIIFFTDADNVLATSDWLRRMVQPYQEYPEVTGFLPQTIPAPDSNSLDRYLGYLFTDPFTWFMYGASGNPQYWSNKFHPLKKTSNYTLYRFNAGETPLFGLSQGVGVHKRFNRGADARADDLLSGIKLMEEGHIIAYIPMAGVYHYHVSGLRNFISKYSWRIRNNWRQDVKGMGLVHRISHFPLERRIRMWLFFPYALTIIFPAIDTLRLLATYKDPVVFWHVPATVILALTMIRETIAVRTGKTSAIGEYK